MAMPDLQRYHWKVFISVRIRFSLLLINKKCANHFCRETANENEQFKETNILISNSNFIKKEGTVKNFIITFGITLKAPLTSFLVLSMLSVFPIKLSWPNSSFIVCGPCSIIYKKYRKTKNHSQFQQILGFR